jgi:hypothetical protein
MHLTTVLSPLLLLPALVAAKPAATPCIVPLVLFTSLDKPFSLSALAPKTDPFTVVTEPDPTKETIGKPIITRRLELVPTLFSLKEGKLIRNGFTAETLPVPAIFPPPLTPFVFGGQGPRGAATFSAGYTCDANGEVFLELRSDDDFAVKCAKEGSQVFLKPDQFQGMFDSLAVGDCL